MKAMFRRFLALFRPSPRYIRTFTDPLVSDRAKAVLLVMAHEPDHRWDSWALIGTIIPGFGIGQLFAALEELEAIGYVTTCELPIIEGRRIIEVGRELTATHYVLTRTGKEMVRRMVEKKSTN